MNKLSIMTALFLVALAGCDATPEYSADNQQMAAKDPNSYANQPVKNSWPGNDSSQLTLATNLLASNYYLVLDGSGSMKDSSCSGGESKMVAAKKAVAAFAQQIPANANLGLYVFDHAGSSERVALGANNKNLIVNAINQVHANAGTPLRTAITSGYNSLEKQAKKQLGYGEYHLVVITDGEANESEEPDPIVAKILTHSPVVLHTIGFCISGGHSLNQPGKIDYKQANDPASLAKGLQEVLAESPEFQQNAFEG